MSLSPFASTSAANGLAPIIFFLEARLADAAAKQGGQKLMVAAQMGVSMSAAENLSLAMLTRTSGVLLMAGVGSYCAYRICRRLLGKDFVWTLLDSAKCDMLARADCRLLHPAAEGFYTVRLGEDDLQKIQEFLLHNAPSTLMSVGRSRRRLSSCSSTTSLWKRMVREQEQGLASILLDLSCAADQGTSSGRAASSKIPCRFQLISSTLRRRSQVQREDDEDTQSTSSEMSSVSHHHNQSHPKYAKKSHRNRIWSFSTAASNEEDLASVTSASLRIVWQGEQDWEDEFQMPEAGREHRSSTPSGISQLSAFKNLEKMFSQEGQYWQEENDEPKWLPSSSQQNPRLSAPSSIYGDEEDDNNPSALYSNTDYMYHSVTVERGDITASEVMSMCSERSGHSNLSTMHCRQRTPSHGLWELTTDSRRNTPERSQGLVTQSGRRQVGASRRASSKDQMTDSCFSKSSFASSSGSSASLPTSRDKQRHTTSKGKPSCTSMFDSAIGMESECLLGGEETDAFKESKQVPSDANKLQNPGIMRRNWLLDEIEESDSSPKHQPQVRSKKASHSSSTSLSDERSLEWF